MSNTLELSQRITYPTRQFILIRYGGLYMEKQQCVLNKVTWAKVASAVEKVNPVFATLINQLSPDDSFAAYELTVSYGTPIFKEGILYLPNKRGQLIPVTDPDIPSSVREDLSYRNTPICMVLSEAVEAHHETSDRVIPLTIFKRGDFFGLWEAFDSRISHFLPRLVWNISAGLRSVFFLPKISERSGIERLRKEFGLRINKTVTFKDQFHILKEVINHPSFNSGWECKVLIFGKKFFEKISSGSDVAWQPVENHLLKCIWNQSGFWRFEIALDLVYHYFSEQLRKEGAVCSSYPFEMLKHLIRIGVGGLPAFRAGSLKESGIPIEEVQKIFMEIYRLKYVPTLMIPDHFDIHKKMSLYNSINVPTLIERVPKTREVSNVMQITRETMMLLRFFQEQALQGNLMLENTKIFEMLKVVDFEGYHTDSDSTQLLKMTAHLPKKDPTFLSMPEGYGKREFCDTSIFLRGCIQLSSS